MTIPEKIEAVNAAEVVLANARSSRDAAIKALLISTGGDEVLEDGEVAVASATVAYAAVNGSLILLKPRFFVQFPPPVAS